MLENSVWRQYNQTNSFKEQLSRYVSVDIEDIIDDDKVLYGILKSKLTKKELRLFAATSADIDDETLMQELHYDAQQLQEAKKRLFKKLKQDKIRNSIKASSIASDEDFS